MLLSTLRSLLVSWLYLWPDDGAVQTPLKAPSPAVLNFQLRHQHAVSPAGHVAFSDIHPSSSGLNTLQSSTLRAKSIKRHRPSSAAAFENARIRSKWFAQSEALQWEEDEVLAPDVESRDTLLELAKMTYDAYLDTNDTNWYDLDGKWNVVSRLQWHS